MPSYHIRSYTPLPSQPSLQVVTNILFFDCAPTLSVAHALARASGDADAARLVAAAGLASDATPAAALCKLIAAICGARMNPYAGHRARAVVHHQVSDEQVAAVVAAAAVAADLMRGA